MARARAPERAPALAPAPAPALGLGVGEPRARVREKLAAFRSFVLLHGVARSFGLLPFLEEADPVRYGLAGGWLTGCLALSFARRAAHLAPRLALPALALQLAWTFPYTANHFALELLAVALLAFLPRGAREADERLVLQGLQWLAVIVLFHTGLQKVLHGWYFGGELLATMVAVQGRFADLFALLLPGQEVARLQGLDLAEVGAGPFRVEHWPFVLVSNAVWIAELVLPFLLVWPRTRTAASVAALALVFAIQLGAREIGFALLFANLLLLFPPGPWPRRALPVAAAVYAWVLAEIHGWLPVEWLGRGPYL